MRCSLLGQPVERFNVAESAGTPRKTNLNCYYEIADESALFDSVTGRIPERLRGDVAAD